MLKYYTSIFLLLFFINTGMGQSNADNNSLDLIEQSHSKQGVKKKTRPKVKALQAVNPLYWVYKGSLGLYQKHISPQLATNCIYETSCSRFSRKLIHHHGLIKGFFLSCDRISRCNRITLAESSPLRLNRSGKVIEHPEDYSFR